MENLKIHAVCIYTFYLHIPMVYLRIETDLYMDLYLFYDKEQIKWIDLLCEKYNLGTPLHQVKIY